MTSLTPNADAARTMIDRRRAVTAARYDAPGYDGVSTRVSGTILAAALLARAKELDRGSDPDHIRHALAQAISNAIISTAGGL